MLYGRMAIIAIVAVAAAFGVMLAVGVPRAICEWTGINPTVEAVVAAAEDVQFRRYFAAELWEIRHPLTLIAAGIGVSLWTLAIMTRRALRRHRGFNVEAKT